MPYKSIEDRRAWAKRYAREWRARNPERAMENVLRSRDPEKHRARSAVAYAKRTGRLVSEPCEVCGVQDVQAHHDDYSKPLEIRWLCAIHHAQADRA